MTQQEFQQRYTYNPVTDKLGEGGFGKVFKAYDTYLDKWVAMKIAPVGEIDTIRLKKEVEMVSQLSVHPNIAHYEACYTFSSFDGEYDFGILQYYEEGNLLQLMNKTLLGFKQKTAILTQILDGLEFLHGHGIIHRDLKPQNILMVRRQNGEYIPKITDFGISKKFDVNQSAAFSNSLGGAGTLAYSSPEQLFGREIRKNADLWSFGVITFRVLTGQLPFDTGGHASTSEAGRQELFRQINSGRLPDSINQIPEPWQTLIRCCLITDPVQRIKTVQDAKAMLSCRDGARPVSTKTTDDPTKIDRPPIQSPKPLTPPNPVRVNTDTSYPPPPPPLVLKYMLIAACTTVIVCLTVFFWQQLHSGSKGNNNTELTVVPSDTVSIIQDSTVQEPPPTERTSGVATTAQTQPARTPVQEPPKQEATPAERTTGSGTTVQTQPTVNRFANYSETTNNLNIQMIAVQGGTFTMGCTSEQGNDCKDDEKPAHRVTVGDFYIGKYEVTQAQWRAVMGNKPSYFNGDNSPVENVSWNDVQDFIRKLNASTGKQYRLPTEAEWEFATRGGNSSRGTRYSGSNTVDNVAWYYVNSGGTTHPVGTKSANDLGIYDMSGNVWEWCSDWYGSYSSNAQTNPQGPSSGSYRVLRGGSWNFIARYTRVSYRFNSTPDRRISSTGFRLACSSN